MAYEKQTWQTGDVVTSAKLNHMEDGIASASSGGALAITITKTVFSQDEIHYEANRTAGEIKAALEAGQVVTIPYTTGEPIEGESYNIDILGTPEAACYFGYVEEMGYALQVPSEIAGSSQSITMIAATLDDYPFASEGGK